MSGDQYVIIIILMFAVGVLVSVGGIPKGILCLYYFVAGIAFLSLGWLISTFLGIDYLEMLALKHATPTMAMPVTLGYPFLIVGVFGLLKSFLSTETRNIE